MNALARLARNPWTLAVVLTVVGFAIAARHVQPAPPRHLVLATGSEQGAYHAFGQRYRAALAVHGIELELRPSAGSVENLDLLLGGLADLAFVQGGVATDAAQQQLVGLATLFHEPLWIFHRAALPLDGLAGLRGARLNIGPEGSGTRAVALELLAAIGIAPADVAELDGSPSQQGADRLAAGTLDAGFFIAAASSPLIAALAADERLALLDIPNGLAYERHFRYLRSVLLDAGMLDLAAHRPPRPVHLLAPLASLAARADIHPAIVHLLLEAARAIHGPGGLFEEPGDFPSATALELPLASAADHYFRMGPSFLYRVLPFEAASLADRLKILLLPLLTLMLPLLRVAPPLYRWRIRSRIYRWYRVLRSIEQQWSRDKDGERVLQRLATIDREVEGVSVPPSYGEEFYNLRMHMDRLRDEIERASRSKDARTG